MPYLAAREENYMECPRCGAESMKKICEFCGCEMPQRKEEGPQTINNDNSRVIINNYYQSGESPTPQQEHTVDLPIGKPKSKVVALTLCILFGYFGAHKFYEGKTKTGILYIFTIGLFGIGWIVDIIALAMKSNPYYV